uniref:Secreted protein n=1 Tax=Parascaris univalens TaxID=6257 RepID=A0A914ZCA4_PARUN
IHSLFFLTIIIHSLKTIFSPLTLFSSLIFYFLLAIRLFLHEQANKCLVPSGERQDSRVLLAAMKVHKERHIERFRAPFLRCTFISSCLIDSLNAPHTNSFDGDYCAF